MPRAWLVLNIEYSSTRANCGAVQSYATHEHQAHDETNERLQQKTGKSQGRYPAPDRLLPLLPDSPDVED